MLFTESQLGTGNAFSILDNATYLTEQEVRMSPQMIPIVENNRLQAYVVDFNGIKQLSESTGLNYFDSIVAVAESDGVSLDQVCISIDEADLIEDPELANLGSIVVVPISKYDPIYQLCESWANELLNEEESESWLGDAISKISTAGLNAGTYLYRKFHPKFGSELDSARKTYDDLNQWRKDYKGDKNSDEYRQNINKLIDAEKKLDNLKDSDETKKMLKWGLRGAIAAPVGVGLAGITGAGVGVYKLIQAYRNKPKSVIAKKIASLRSIYQKWMAKAQSSKDSGIAAKLKRGAAKILQVIDKLMAFLQRKADGK